MEATQKKPTIVNGINTEQLFSTIDLIKKNPDIAKFKFRATNKWVAGTHCRGTINGFYGALKEDDSRPPVDYDMDEPPFYWVIMKAEIRWSTFLSRSPAALRQALSLMLLQKG